MARTCCHKSTDDDKPHFDSFFYHNINVKENVFLQRCELKKVLRDTLTRAAWYGLSKTSVFPMSQFYVIKQRVNAIVCTIELWYTWEVC